MKKEKRLKFEDMKQNLADVISNSKTVEKLEELKKHITETLDKQIERLMREKGIVKRIKFPKVKFNWRYFLSIPFIYGMIVPSVFLHLCVQIYQQVAFRLYGIPRVNSKEYFVYDRQLLSMLSPLEKFNCVYCSYVNNLFRFCTEIGARTERYWCPIKYYRRVENTHSQYDKFIEGDETKEEIYQKWEELREFSDLGNEKKE